MGMRGPTPKRTNAVAPKGAPKPPPGMDGEALAEWSRVTGEMAEVGTLAMTDRAALTEYCMAWEMKRRAEAVIDEHGFSFETTSGQVKQRPEVNIVLRFSGVCMNYLDRFGLNPAGRMRVDVANPDLGDEDFGKY